MSEATLFAAALEKPTPEERAAYLAEACAGDDRLRRRVEALLAAHAGADEILDRPGAGSFTDRYQPVTEAAGTIIGPYKLLQRIGEGGFGVVYMAEQEKPVRRMVALKIIKPGMDTAQVIARFESERQALALMDHPNIARVFDAGATESGRPYFVMELVKGVPVTEFCDRNHMPAEQRLKLFIDVCHAIQHAHHKGVIHRDIKPTNVLVTLHDGVPVVKVIDFGVAKATVQKLTEKTLFTAFGQMIGTPAYMSPEQAEMSGLDIDTRSDVYALGVLLYELLTGTTPLESKRLREAGYAEMQRLIREEEPPRPSTRLSSLGESATILAGNRGLDVKRLARLLSGDLDWVVMKALEKDRNRRYGSPADFAADVDRYLRHDAILARPPTTAYRLAKFARRNRAAVLTAGGVAAALLVGTTVATWQAVRATRAEAATRVALDEAEQARAAEADQRRRAEADEQKALAAATAEKQARETAQSREAETKAVLDFVQNKVFAAAGPQGQEGGLGREVTLRKAVEAAIPFVEKSFPNQPLIEARLRGTLGNTFLLLGEAEKARQQHQRAFDLMKAEHGPDHRDTIGSMGNLANSYDHLGRTKEALKLREEALAQWKAKYGPDHLDTLKGMLNLGKSYFVLGRYAEALKLNEEVVTRLKAVLGPDHPDTLQGMKNLATSYEPLGRHAEALKLREETLKLRTDKFGPDHPDTLGEMFGLAVSYFNLGRHAEARKLSGDVLALQKAKLGPDHPNTLATMNILVVSYAGLGRYAEALRVGEETLELMQAKLGRDHPNTLQSMNNLTAAYAAVNRHAEALKLSEETLALMVAKHGPDHPHTRGSMNNLAWCLATIPDAKLRDPRRAVELAAKAVEAWPKEAGFRGTLGTARYRTGDWKGAIADLERAVRLRKADDAMNAAEGFFLATAHWQLGEKEKAREWFAKSVAWMDKGKKDEPGLKLIHAEAADLLGVAKPEPPGKSSPPVPDRGP